MGNLIENARNLDWGYIMSTLIIRFIGVFLVLAILMLGMILLGKIVSRLVASQEARSAPKEKDDPPVASLAEPPDHEAGEEEMVAVIGAAIALAMDSELPGGLRVSPSGATAGSWVATGRVAAMNARLQGGGYRRS